jgi:hypothetical protein
VRYTLSSPDQPTQEDLFQAENMTIAFVNDVISANFDFSDGIEIEKLDTVAVKNSADPAQISFETSIKYTSGSLDVPTQADMNALVASVFEQPTVQTLLLLLNNLPADNPFSTTTSTTFINQGFGSQVIGPLPGSRMYSTNTSTNNTMTGLGIAAIASTCVVGLLLGGIVLLRRSDYANTLGKYPQKFSPYMEDEEAPIIAAHRSGSYSGSSINSRRSGGSRRSLKKQPSSKGEDMEIEFVPQTEAEIRHCDDPLFTRPFCQADLIDDRSKSVLSPDKPF